MWWYVFNMLCLFTIDLSTEDVDIESLSLCLYACAMGAWLLLSHMINIGVYDASRFSLYAHILFLHTPREYVRKDIRENSCQQLEAMFKFAKTVIRNYTNFKSDLATHVLMRLWFVRIRGIFYNNPHEGSDIRTSELRQERARSLYPLSDIKISSFFSSEYPAEVESLLGWIKSDPTYGENFASRIHISADGEILFSINGKPQPDIIKDITGEKVGEKGLPPYQVSVPLGNSLI